MTLPIKSKITMSNKARVSLAIQARADLEASLTEKQREVYDSVSANHGWNVGEGITARRVAENMGLEHNNGSLTHWIRPQLDALVKKGLLSKTLCMDGGINNGKNLYVRTKVMLDASDS